jgi:PAS domain S-box-containing protein/diguanylate cyclase (GGDEF)-like protein
MRRADVRPVLSASELRDEIEREYGELPVFFEPAFANGEVLRALWHQTRLGWVESPVPPAFRVALLNALAERAPWPWGVVADEADRLPGSRKSDQAEWPAGGHSDYDELLALTVQLVVDGPDERVRTQLQKLLGWSGYASLIAFLTYLETCRTFAQAHPGLAAAADSGAQLGDKRAPAILEVDERGLIISCSPTIEKLFGQPAAALTNTPFRDLFADDQGDVLDRCTAELRKGDLAPLSKHSFKLLGRRADGSAFDTVVTVTNRAPDGRPERLTAAVEEGAQRAGITYRTGHTLLMSMAEGGLSPAHADPPLADLARRLGWEHMLLWRFDPEHRLLDCVATHHLGGEPSSDVESRVGTTLRSGEGKVGAAFQTGVPEWQADVRRNGVSALTSGLWLPIGSRSGPVGVVELLSTDVRQPDSALLELFSMLGRAARSDSLDQAAEQEAADMLSRARLAFEAAPVGMALVSLEPGKKGIITEVNRALAILVGRDERDLVGRPIRDLSHPEDLEVDVGLEAQLQAGEIPSYEIEKRFLRADGEVFLGALTVSLVRSDDETRRPVYVVVQLADVTERKQVEEALGANRDRLVSVFDEAPIGMALTTLDDRWLEVNDALCEALGYSETELLHKNLNELMLPDDLGMLKRYLQYLYTGEVLGYHIETRATRGDGEVIWIQLSVSLIHDYRDKPQYVFYEVQDISERKRLEEELEQGALLDAVTGLPSRTLLFDRLDQAHARLVRSGALFVVMFVVTEGIDDVRSEFGRERADAVLRELGSRLMAAVRAGDSVARYSDDEFIVVCDPLRDREEANAIADRILELGAFTTTYGSVGVDVSVTLGVTVATSENDSAATLVQRADAAAHRARLEGAQVIEESATS